jgi:hypothetical protein
MLKKNIFSERQIMNNFSVENGLFKMNNLNESKQILALAEFLHATHSGINLKFLCKN